MIRSKRVVVNTTERNVWDFFYDIENERYLLRFREIVNEILNLRNLFLG